MMPVLPVPVGIRIKQGESKLLRWSIAKSRASAWCCQSLRLVAFDIASNIRIHPRSCVHAVLPANDGVSHVVRPMTARHIDIPGSEGGIAEDAMHIERH